MCSGAAAAWHSRGEATLVTAGRTHRAGGLEVVPQTLFDLASLTKPFVASAFDGLFDDATQALRERNVPVLPSPERAVRCLWALHRYHEILSR